MKAGRWMAVALAGFGVAACGNVLPQPDYVSVKTPPAFRTDPDGTRIDNEDYRLDAEGFRLNKNGNRIGDVDVDVKMGTDPSNPLAGYYISSTGQHAPGRVARPSEGAGAGAGYGPGSVTAMPTNTAPPPPATGAPAPLAPPPLTLPPTR